MGPASPRSPAVAAGWLAVQIALASAGAGMLAAGGLHGAPWGVPLALWTLAGGAGTVLLVLAGRRLFQGARDLPVSSPGLANGLTLLRLVWTAPVCVLLSHGAYDGALGLYALLVLSDVLDGIVARARRETSAFGVVMDPLADVISTFAVFTVFMVDNLVPLWLYLLLASRYAMLLLGSAILSVVAGPVAYRATIPGKVVGVVQAAGAAALMWGARAGGLEPGPARAVFAVLGLGFASIVVSQGVIGWRHLRNTTRGRTIGRGSSR